MTTNDPDSTNEKHINKILHLLLGATYADQVK